MRPTRDGGGNAKIGGAGGNLSGEDIDDGGEGRDITIDGTDGAGRHCSILKSWRPLRIALWVSRWARMSRALRPGLGGEVRARWPERVKW